MGPKENLRKLAPDTECKIISVTKNFSSCSMQLIRNGVIVPGILTVRPTGINKPPRFEISAEEITKAVCTFIKQYKKHYAF